jgi:archaemetzincin
MCFANCSADKKGKPDSVVIILQPFNDIARGKYEYVYAQMKKVYPHVKLNPPIPLPQQAFNKERNRYRADTIIRILRDNTPEGFVTLGLTSSDISYKKGNIADWGVMGLGHRPGKACVASDFRLSSGQKTEQLFKVAIHEVGHTQGLEHCKVKSCFMRDAEGRNPTNEEVEFCAACKSKLTKKGWSFLEQLEKPEENVSNF